MIRNRLHWRITAVFVIIFLLLCYGTIQVQALPVNGSKWNLFFEDIVVTNGSIEAQISPTITDSTKTQINYSVNLDEPGEFYEFTVNIVNLGTVDAMVDDININQLTEKQKKYLLYSITYADGSKIKKYDKLEAGKTEQIRIRIEYKSDIVASDLPEESTTLNLSLTTYYVQADENAVDRSNNSQEEENGNNQNSKSNDSSDNSEITEDNQDNIKSNTSSKRAKTGDDIVKYVIILVLAIFALYITHKKIQKTH